jgi:hypothetical protein
MKGNQPIKKEVISISASKNFVRIVLFLLKGTCINRRRDRDWRKAEETKKEGKKGDR